MTMQRTDPPTAKSGQGPWLIPAGGSPGQAAKPVHVAFSARQGR